MRRVLLRIIIFAVAPTALVAQDVRVLVLDAVNGKPQRGAEVHHYCQTYTRNIFPVASDTTNTHGIAIVSYSCKENQKMVFFVTALPKDECADLGAVTFRQISGEGIVSSPDGEGEMQCP